MTAGVTTHAVPILQTPVRATTRPQPTTAVQTPVAEPAPYRGPDRRQATATRSPIGHIVGATVLITALWLAIVIPALAGTDASRDAASDAIVTATDALCGAILLATALLLLSIWRITGTGRAAWGAIAATVGATYFPLAILVGSITVTDAGDQTGLVRGVTKLVIIGVGIAALASPQVNARLRPGRILAPLAVLVAMAAAAMPFADPEFTKVVYLARAVEATVAVGWVVLVVGFARLVIRHRRPGDVAIITALVLLAVGSASRAVTGQPHDTMAVTTSGVTLVIVTVILSSAVTRLWQLHRDRGSRLLRATGILQTGRARIADLESVQARRLHDARNAIFAIAGATELLVNPCPTRPVDAHQVQRLITAELDRLGHLLERQFRGTTSTFTAAEIIDPLVAAYRAHGVRITSTIAPCRIHGNREALTNAITNILTNARVHAPGATIDITARFTAPDTVTITLADDGPGIGFADHTRLLLPGTRGNTAAPGSGIGLASAKQALSDLGGTLRLTDRKGGGTMIIFTVPGHPDSPRPTQRPQSPRPDRYRSAVAARQ